VATSPMRDSCYTLDGDPPQPGFVACYLRVSGDECAFIETNTAHTVPILLAALEKHGLAREDVRYVIVTHAHLDHAGGAGALMKACPRATLLAHPRAARHLIEPSKLVASATSVYGAERFQALYGVIEPIPAARVQALEDGATVLLGDATLRFLHTRGHAKHHFVVHDPAMSTVFTGDTLGLVYPRLQRDGLFALISSSPTDFEPEEARKSLDRIVALKTDTAHLTHFGAVRDVVGVATQLRRWVDRSERWLEEAVKSTGPMADVQAHIRQGTRAAIAEQATSLGLVLTDDDWKFLAVDVDLNAQGIAFAAERLRSPHGG
jgi:glyoxylase-like metal-dependent hydrolase (beta-lactamase superfamily II)